MFDYYWRGDNDADEVIIQVVNDKLSIRVTECEYETESSMVHLDEEEIDRMIAGLQAAKQKIQNYKLSHR